MNRNSELLPTRVSRRTAREPSFEIHVSLRVDTPQAVQHQPNFDVGITQHDGQIPCPTVITPLTSEVSITVQVAPPPRRRSSSF